MGIKMIACDMDGTLLDSKKNISAANREAIAEFVARGNKFLIATGRMYISAVPYAKILGLEIPLVTYNGALVRNSLSGEVLYEKKMNLRSTQKVLDYCRSKGFYLQCYVGDKLFIDKENAHSRKYAALQNISIDAIGEDVYTAKEEPYKILVMTYGNDFKETYGIFKKELDGIVDVTSSQENFLELMEPCVNKWEAVKKVAAMYNIAPQEIMCIGDSENDLEMVAKAGVGVAVGNAVESVMRAARIVTASNDDNGVALVIERILSEQAVE
ncbi:MAG: Cof-type HAD-IIB family hydrolase [Acidaminococcaceae bacterium]|nr:Cof-type HAD-IIB family hydrolase [Acidaminococcaceae bacterium]